MHRLIILFALLALVATACSNGADAATDTTIATTATTTTTAAPPTTVADTTTTTTTAGTTTTTAATPAADEPPPYYPGEDSEADAAVEAFKAVFDSETTFEEKAPFLVEPEGLEETVAAYAETGKQVGGVSVVVSHIGIDGDQATISYTLRFAGNPTYGGLQGTAVRTDAGWQVSRIMFCTLMTSARVGCPSE